VYHGSWAGREVAIKVIQDTTDTEEVSIYAACCSEHMLLEVLHADY
jgi:hypothetical protein